ncbi:MAG: PDZ domain-containing protein [Tissierellia bacterium]|nr:PDZ domain-containing protein [Tissierellia bacterium]
MKQFLKNVLLIILIATLTGVVFGFTFDYLQARNRLDDIGPEVQIEEPEEAQIEKAYEVETKIELVEGSVIGIIEEIKNSVVSVSNLRSFMGSEPQVVSSGSGVFYKEDESHYYLMTNFHVIDGASLIQITLSNGTKVDGLLMGDDEDTDLAVLSIEKSQIPEEEEISLAKIGSSDRLVVGEDVLAIGNALGLGQSVTKGIVSALERDSGISSQMAYKMIQTDAAINPGNSGGGLFNISGELIGINSQKIGGDVVEGVGFAIPIDSAYEISNILLDKGYLPVAYLGVAMEDINSDILDYYDLPRGVSVAYVEPGSPADLAGLKENDLILKIDDIETPRSDQLRSLIRSYSAGDKVKLTIFRYDHVEELEAVLAETPKP